jgi:GTP-binding protein
VIADIPGLIEGAAEGAGLGIQFLKHVSRTLLLLHMVDVAPFDGSDPVDSVRVIEQELAKFSDELVQRERWLVLNKLDLLPEEEREKVCADIIGRLGWEGPVYRIAALSKEGTVRLMQDIMAHLEQEREEAAAADDKA